MNKKCFSYIIITLLCLNLLPQPSNAFKLNQTKDDVIYSCRDEKSGWENFYLPYAKHLKLVNKTTTILDIVKNSEETENNDLIIEIMKRTDHERAKLIVKWERDNGYIATKAEKNYNITPLVRRKLLTEIEEEEKRKNEKENQIWWKRTKANIKGVAACGAFVVSTCFKKDILTIASSITLAITTFSTIADYVEAYFKGNNKEEEIELPPLRNMPVLPENYKRVDIYSL